MNTSPDRDGRLLPWIDATGTQVDPGWRNWHTRTAVNRDFGRSSRSPGAEERIGYYRLMTCLSHENHERCKVYGDD